jgi:hypothetical protein
MAIAGARSWTAMALHSTVRWLSRQRVEILIVFGLALVGGVCGWLLREQLMKNDDEAPLEISSVRTGLLVPSGELDRPASALDRQVGASLGS